MENKIAKIINSVLHPLLMPSIALVVVFMVNPHFEIIPLMLRLKFFVLAVILTGLLPITLIPILYETGKIKKYLKSANHEWVFALSIIFIGNLVFLITINSFIIVGLTLIFYTLLSCIITVFAALLISIRWTISYNMAAFGNFTGILISLMILFQSNLLYFLLLSILLAGLVGFSRLQLNYNTPAQVYAGYSMGLLISIISFSFL